MITLPSLSYCIFGSRVPKFKFEMPGSASFWLFAVSWLLCIFGFQRLGSSSGVQPQQAEVFDEPLMLHEQVHAVQPPQQQQYAVNQPPPQQQYPPPPQPQQQQQQQPGAYVSQPPQAGAFCSSCGVAKATAEIKFCQDCGAPQ